MKKSILWLALCVAVGGFAWLGGMFAASGNVEAQAAAAREYGLLLPVSSEESYRINLDRWAGDKDLKALTKTNVFTYQVDGNEFNDRAAYVRRMNELAGAGWTSADAAKGLLVRSR